MGFFSQNCHGCGHPALCRQATNEVNAWMVHVVAIQPNGSILIGDYDGYGMVGNWDGAIGFTDASVWHQACWREAGKPTEYAYKGASPWAEDQGWFFDSEHDMAEPGTA